MYSCVSNLDQEKGVSIRRSARLTRSCWQLAGPLRLFCLLFWCAFFNPPLRLRIVGQILISMQHLGRFNLHRPESSIGTANFGQICIKILLKIVLLGNGSGTDVVFRQIQSTSWIGPRLLAAAPNLVGGQVARTETAKRVSFRWLSQQLEHGRR
jgi:hypothetical protein